MARGDDQPGSDVDLLVDPTDGASLLDEIGLRLALVDLLRVEVDVVAVCDVLARLVGDHLEAFLADVRTQWACGMGLIRIGEAVNRIPGEVLQRFPQQPWRQIVAMTNFAAHQYDDLDPRRAWRTVTRDVPALRAYLTDTVTPGLSP